MCLERIWRNNSAATNWKWRLLNTKCCCPIPTGMFLDIALAYWTASSIEATWFDCQENMVCILWSATLMSKLSEKEAALSFCLCPWKEANNCLNFATEYSRFVLESYLRCKFCFAGKMPAQCPCCGRMVPWPTRLSTRDRIHDTTRNCLRTTLLLRTAVQRWVLLQKKPLYIPDAFLIWELFTVVSLLRLVVISLGLLFAVDAILLRFQFHKIKQLSVIEESVPFAHKEYCKLFQQWFLHLWIQRKEIWAFVHCAWLCWMNISFLCESMNSLTWKEVNSWKYWYFWFPRQKHHDLVSHTFRRTFLMWQKIIVYLLQDASWPPLWTIVHWRLQGRKGFVISE